MTIYPMTRRVQPSQRAGASLPPTPVMPSDSALGSRPRVALSSGWIPAVYPFPRFTTGGFCPPDPLGFIALWAPPESDVTRFGTTSISSTFDSHTENEQA